MRKKGSLVIMALFYFIAGINHFNNPDAYLKIIPDFFPGPDIINIASGIIEITLSILLIIHKTRKVASYGIIIMLIAFIPAHIYMIKTGWCVRNFCFPSWAIWLRLILLQPLLILWAWNNRKWNCHGYLNSLRFLK